MTLHLRRMALAALACSSASLVDAQTFAGHDDFNGTGAKWAYFFRAPALTEGTNGVLTFNGSTLEFTKAAGKGSYLLGWDGDGISGNTTSRLAASFTTSWVADITAINRHVPESGAFSSVGFEIAVGPTAYTEITLESSGGQLRVRTETNSATTGVAETTVSTNSDIRLRLAWDANTRIITVAYSLDGGASYATLRQVPITEWPTLPFGGFYFELLGYSVAAAAIGPGQMQLENFSVTTVPADYPRLTNLSVRNVTAEGDRTLIVGFNVAGEGTRPLVIRAVSQSLSSFNVPNLLTDVDVALYAGSTSVGAATGVSAGMSAAFDRVGAFALASNTTDAATVRSVTSGSYTVHAVPAPGAAKREGATLVELYEDGRYGTRITNLSTRTELGAESPIVGFSISGSSTARVLIRAVGPGLSAFPGVTNFAADPRITLVRQSDKATIAQNDDWGTSAGVAAAAAASGAFALTPGSKDAALVADLPAGGYTVVLQNGVSATGIVLAEVYLVTQ